MLDKPCVEEVSLQRHRRMGNDMIKSFGTLLEAMDYLMLHGGKGTIHFGYGRWYVVIKDK